MDLAALRRWWPLAAVIALLFLASLAATRSAPQLERVQPGRELDNTADDQPEQPRRRRAAVGRRTDAPRRGHRTGLPDWAGTAALVALGVPARGRRRPW